MSALPSELPRLPEGYTQRLVSQLKHGGDAVTASYEVIAPDKTTMPFRYAYRTGADGRFVMSGYFLDGGEEPLTWSQLRLAWPEYLRSKK